MHEASVYRSQINPSNITIKPEEFRDKIKELVKGFGYRLDDIKYKFKEKKGQIDFVMFRLECLKEIDDYTRFRIWIDVQFNKAKRVKEGLKTGGKIIIGSWMIFDYDNKWDGNPFLSLMQGLYERYAYKPTIKKYEGIIATEHEEILQKIKKYIKIHEAKK